MGKNWTYEDQMVFEADVRDSVVAAVAYFGGEPEYKDIEGVDFDEFCDSFF